MDWLKDNKVIVGIAAAVVVVIGLFVAFGTGGDRDDYGTRPAQEKYGE